MSFSFALEGKGDRTSCVVVERVGSMGGHRCCLTHAMVFPCIRKERHPLTGGGHRGYSGRCCIKNVKEESCGSKHGVSRKIVHNYFLCNRRGVHKSVDTCRLTDSSCSIFISDIRFLISGPNRTKNPSRARLTQPCLFYRNGGLLDQHDLFYSQRFLHRRAFGPDREVAYPLHSLFR